MGTGCPRCTRCTACSRHTDASCRLARVQKVCDMLQVPVRYSSLQQSHALHVAGFDSGLQEAAAAVADGSCTVDDLLDTVTVLRIECAPLTTSSHFTAEHRRPRYASEWDALGLFAAAALLVTPAFHGFLQRQWDVLHDAAQHAQSMAAWKVLLTPDDAASCPLPSQEIRAIFNGLLMRSVVPVACAQLKQWDVKSQSSVAHSLMYNWQSVLTDAAAAFIIDNAILPRVIAATEVQQLQCGCEEQCS